MRLETTFLHERIELFGGVYDSVRASELATASRLYNRLLGPVTSVGILRPEMLDLSIYSAHCHHSPVHALVPDIMVKAGPQVELVPGGGKGITQLGAVLGALGEMTERLTAILDATAALDRLPYATYEELAARGIDALGPEEVPLFAAEQYAAPGFAYRPFRPDSSVAWVEGRDLFTDEPVLVPAQLVLLYQRHDPKDTPIGYATTAGFAFHPSRRQAILHGLYEVIERDALNVRWYSRLAPPKVAVDLAEVMSEQFDVRLSRFSTPYLRTVEVLLLSLDMPTPVLATIAFDRSRGERMFLAGSGGASGRARALGQALFELGQLQTGFRFEDPFGRDPIYPDTPLSEITEFFDAPPFYGHERNLPRTYWFTENEQVVQWSDIPSFDFRDEEEEYDVVTGWLRRLGLRVVLFDSSTPAMPDVAVTKVFVPQLTHACPPSNPMLGHPRFVQLPRELGLASRHLTFDDLNPDRIPFA